MVLRRRLREGNRGRVLPADDAKIGSAADDGAAARWHSACHERRTAHRPPREERAADVLPHIDAAALADVAARAPQRPGCTHHRLGRPARRLRRLPGRRDPRRHARRSRARGGLLRAAGDVQHRVRHTAEHDHAGHGPRARLRHEVGRAALPVGDGQAVARRVGDPRRLIRHRPVAGAHAGRHGRPRDAGDPRRRLAGARAHARDGAVGVQAGQAPPAAERGVSGWRRAARDPCRAWSRAP